MTSSGPVDAGPMGQVETITATDHEHILQFFEHGHLAMHLQDVAAPFRDLSFHIMRQPRNPERTVALRKLLEAKDAAVRAAIAK